MKSRLPVFLFILLLLGCASTTSHGEVSYQLSSPDVGVDWHLHAKGGELLCELPCERVIGERSGSYLVVHDPIKAWRVDIPSTLDAKPGSIVSLEPRVGKGHPTLGVFGNVLAIGGALTAAAGVGLAVAGYISLSAGCSAQVSLTQCPNADAAGNLAIAGGVFIASGLLLAVAGVYFSERNRAATFSLRVLPTGVAGTF